MVHAPSFLRRGKHRLHFALIGAAAAAMLPSSAEAASAKVLFQAAPGIGAAQDCESREMQGGMATQISPASPSASQNKSAAILGGASALDAIRAQQEGRADHPLFAGTGAKPLEPAAAPSPRGQAGCGVSSPFAAPAAFDPLKPLSFVPRPAAAPQLAAGTALPHGNAANLVLGSKMVPIARTSFDGDFARVSRARSNLGPTLASIGGAKADKSHLVATVNRWVNRSIQHAEDRELYGRADYWADAATTLRLGKGDCEDFALLKMELLAAAGVARDDMVLTLARDLIRRRDHAVLLVKTDAGFVMLDNVGDAPLDARSDHGYRPVMSLGAKQSWLHGY